jgi:IS5 family transposase
VRRVTKAIRREMRRRTAIEPVIGQMKSGRRMGRNYLKGRDGDRNNAVLAAAGYNFSLLLRWLTSIFVCPFAASLAQLSPPQIRLTHTGQGIFTGDFFHQPYFCETCLSSA